MKTITTIRIPEKLKAALKQECEESDRSQTEVILTALRIYLNQKS